MEPKTPKTVEPSDERLHVVIDTREQRNWTFPVEQVAVHHCALPAGDYSIVGLETRIVVEKKSLGDFVNTVIHDWLRFRKELVRLSGYDAAVVAVEADLGQIWRHEYESDALPTSVIGRMNAIYFDHGIPCLLWGERKFAQDMAHRWLLLAWRKYHVDDKLADPPAPG